MTEYHATTESGEKLDELLEQFDAATVIPPTVFGGAFAATRHAIAAFLDPISTAWTPGLEATLSPTDTRDVDMLLAENIELRFANAELSRDLREMQNRIATVEDQIETLTPSVVVLREISREEAKEEIRELFTTGVTLDYEAIVTKLRLDLELVVELCNELTGEGVIGPHDDVG